MRRWFKKWIFPYLPFGRKLNGWIYDKLKLKEL